MMIGSHKSKNSNLPPLTLKDGKSVWGVHGGLTTTDALQIQHRYCKYRPGFIAKPTLNCSSPDRLGIVRPIFMDRICDSIPDCHEGSDEDGTMGTCSLPQE
jgi:hypothetical protein